MFSKNMIMCIALPALSKPSMQSLGLERALFLQVLRGSFREHYLWLRLGQEISLHHHRLSRTYFQVTTTFSFERCFRFPASKQRSDAISDRFAHCLGEDSCLRQRFAVGHHNLDHIANRIDAR